MRRVVTSAAVLLATALAVTACGSKAGISGASGSSKQIEVLSNFTPDVSRGKVLQQVIDGFNAQSGSDIKVVSKPSADWPTLQTKIRSMISAGTAPDVFLYNYNPNDLSREKSGKLMDWTSALDSDPAWKARFSKANLDAVTVGGQTVGIPSDQSNVFFYYHKDLFAKAGITSFPTTWTQFMTDAAKLKAKKVAPLALMTSDDAWNSMTVLSYLATANGGANAYAVGRSLDNPAVAKAADTMATLLKSDTTADAVGANYSVATQNFLSGQAAVIADGPWLISSIQKQANPCEVGVAVGPTNGDGVAPAGRTVTDSLNVWGAAKQTDDAKAKVEVDFLKYLTSNENAAKMAVEGQYPLAVKTDTSTAKLTTKPDCQMQQVLDLSNTAPAATVEIGRQVSTAAQAKLPSLLEGLALGKTTGAEFAQQLQAANK